MELGKRIADRMKRLGLTQVQLAKRTGLTQQAISQYIRGQVKPGYDNLVSLAQGLAVKPGWFFSEDESADESPRIELFDAVPNPIDADVVAFPDSGKIARDATFTIGHWFPMQQLPPPSAATLSGVVANLHALIFNKLAHLTPPNRIRGALAVDWKPVENGWVFQLRKGVRFHNGEFLTAEDVAGSYQQYLTQNPAERRIQGVEVLDPYFIKIHLKSPCRFDELAKPIIRQAGSTQASEQWNGTGPFQVVELTSGFWRLRRNPHYFFGYPFFEEVHIREYPDPQALEEALVEGTVDFAIGVKHEADGYTVHAEPSTQRYHLHFMLDEPLVQNLPLRWAIARSLDRRALADAAGLTAPLYSPGPFDSYLGDRLEIPPLCEKEMAQQLLDPLDNFPDEVFRVTYYETIPQSRALAEKIVEQLNEVGIRAEIGEPPHAILVTRPLEFLERELQMFQTGSRHNLNGYSNPAVDALIESLQDTEATAPRLLELRQLIQKDVPDVPLFYYEIPVTYRNRLRALENRVLLLTGLNEIHTWYLTDAAESEREKQASEWGDAVNESK
jgi:peptide/nickel transport system substrate-binding protein